VVCIFVDNGLLARRRVESVTAMMRAFSINMIPVDERQQFLKELDGITDAREEAQTIAAFFIGRVRRERLNSRTAVLVPGTRIRK